METQPKISLFASAVRPQFWQRFYESLRDNKVSIEVCFVGPNAPLFDLPDNFHFQLSHPRLKPSQCYEAASRMCTGELIGWTADDVNYHHPGLNCFDSLDIIWEYYERSIRLKGDKKTIFAQRPFEDGNDIWEKHRFFHGDMNSPPMAPLGFMNREWFNQLGGYDRNFVCGQAENDVVMRGLANGGRVEIVTDSKIYIHHKDSHNGDAYTFRHGYMQDREYLEKCWVKEGFGTFESRQPYTLSPTRLLPVEKFDGAELLGTNQGPTGWWGR